MVTSLDFVLLVSVVASGGRSIDRDTLVQIFRTVYHLFPHEEYLRFQEDVRGILGAV